MARKVEFIFDPFEMSGVDSSELDAATVSAVLSDVKDYVLEAVLSDTADLTSSVTGRQFPKLSPQYAKAKKAQGAKPIPNLELDGDMLSALRVTRSGSSLKLHVLASQADKADGHNNHSGESSLPARKFIPSEDLGETFRPAIRSGIKDIVMLALDERPVREEE